MKFTVEELNDIANNKPYGYFKALKEERKGQKAYSVQVKGATYVHGPVKVYEVLAKNKAEAQDLAQDKYVKDHTETFHSFQYVTHQKSV